MAPEVLVRQIPAPDIRYKDKVSERPEVIGLLEKDGEHVRGELREAAREALQAVIEHIQR